MNMHATGSYHKPGSFKSLPRERSLYPGPSLPALTLVLFGPATLQRRVGLMHDQDNFTGPFATSGHPPTLLKFCFASQSLRPHKNPPSSSLEAEVPGGNGRSMGMGGAHVLLRDCPLLRTVQGTRAGDNSTARTWWTGGQADRRSCLGASRNHTVRCRAH